MLRFLRVLLANSFAWIFAVIAPTSLKNQITLLRVIPTMTFIRFVTGKSSGILSGISSGILFYLANLLAYLLAFYLAYLLAFYLTFYLALYLAYLLAFYLAVEVHKCLLTSGRSQVEVQWCPLTSEGPGLRSTGAHWARNVPYWGPVVPTELWARKVPGWGPVVPHSDRKPAVEVQQCPLRTEVAEDIGEELGEELAKSLAKSLPEEEEDEEEKEEANSSDKI